MTAGLHRFYADEMLLPGKVIFAVLIYERPILVVITNRAGAFP
jgi:hypothetical protein